MCNNFPNIRITEGNNFSIILPLLSRTYVATRPIDEEIDPERLQNVVVIFGGVTYPVRLAERGVQIDLPATLAVGTYNILLTAEYLGSSIRAAYESAVTIVPWSEQSTAEQYIAGSPIVLRAAYVLSGALTDSELEALKEEYREKNAQLDQAIADAEAAKREWEEKAADLDGVAKEATSQHILAAVENIDIDTGDLAKQGTNPNATLSEVQRMIGELGADQEAVAECYGVAQEKGLTIPAPTQQTLQNLPDTMRSIVAAYQTFAYLSAATPIAHPGYPEMNFMGVYFIGSMQDFARQNTYITKIDNLRGEPTSLQSFCAGCSNLVWLNLTGLFGRNVTSTQNFLTNPCPVTTLVGDMTIEEVIENDVRVLDGLNIALSIYAWYTQNINRQSLRALINGLADRTGQSALTLVLGGANFARLTAEDIEVATNKNWNVTA